MFPKCTSQEKEICKFLIQISTYSNQIKNIKAPTKYLNIKFVKGTDTDISLNLETFLNISLITRIPHILKEKHCDCRAISMYMFPKHLRKQLMTFLIKYNILTSSHHRFLCEHLIKSYSDYYTKDRQKRKVTVFYL